MQQTHGKRPRGEREKIINFLNMIKAKANELTMTMETGAMQGGPRGPGPPDHQK